MTGEMQARLEMSLMFGSVVRISERDVINVMNYLSSALGYTEIGSRANGAEIAKFLRERTEAKPVAVSCSTICGMPCATIILQDEGEELDIASAYGVFSYVYNFAAPECSEFGYSFFERMGNGYHRIA